MVKVNARYISNLLNGRILESIKQLNMVKDALDPCEQKAIGQINEIIERISHIEV